MDFAGTVMTGLVFIDPKKEKIRFQTCALLTVL
jgi:hypothetical protein